jgi:hypothetical protein
VALSVQCVRNTDSLDSARRRRIFAALHSRDGEQSANNIGAVENGVRHARLGRRGLLEGVPLAGHVGKVERRVRAHVLDWKVLRVPDERDEPEIVARKRDVKRCVRPIGDFDSGTGSRVSSA